jgi:hypothetical protein
VNLSIISPGCHLHAEGYAGLYTPDVQPWAVIHCISDVDPTKLTARTGRMASSTDLKKMVKDALCSDNYFGLSPAELANGTYKLPRMAHYHGPLDMDSIVKWLRETIGMTSYMVHAYFRPFLLCAFDTPLRARHQQFSLDHLLPGEVVAPRVDDTLADFPADRDWSPSHGPCGYSYQLTIESAPGTLANAPSAPTADHCVDPLASPSTQDDEMADPEVTPANVPTATSQSTAD